MRLLVFALVVCLIAISGVTSAQLADTQWPMFHHDLNHTGRSPYVGPGVVGIKWCYKIPSFSASAD